MEAPGEPQAVDVAVLGGGISGLTAGLRLALRGRTVVVIEKDARPGGAIRTLENDAGFLFELGPNTVLSGSVPVAELIRSAGLETDRIEADRAARRRYIVKSGGLVPLPSGPLGLLRTRVFSTRTKLRLLREPFLRRAPAGREESIAEFTRRRLGPELLERAVGPFVSGVYAGDPERLSVEHATPKIAALEREHGSLIRGALAKRKGPAPAGRPISFRRGLATLPRGIAERLGSAWVPAHRVKSIALSGTAFEVVATGAAGERRWRAKAVISAVPARAAVELLRSLDPGVDETLGDLPQADVAVVSLGFRRDDVGHPLDGFGFLAPTVENRFVLGCLFPSTLFPDRAPPGHVALSAFIGGRRYPERVSLPEDEIRSLAVRDLGPLLELRGDPVFTHVERWRPAIPQYEIGHGRRKEAAARLEASLPGFFLSGNALHGVSIPDCIRNATALAERADHFLASKG